MEAWQKIQIGIATSLIVLSLGAGTAFKSKQTKYDAELNKAQATLSQKKKQLSTIQSDNELALLDQKQNSSNQATSDSVRQVMLNRAINTRAIKVAKALFNYSGSKDYLKRQNKVSVLLSKKATVDPALFPKHDLEQIKGQKIAGDYYSSSITNGLEDSDGNVPVFLKVHYGTYLNDKLIASPTEGFNLTYNTHSGQFTSLRSVGKFAENTEKND